MTKLIGLTGKAGSGKDTVARLILNITQDLDLDEITYLIEYRDMNGFQYGTVYGFADPIYKMLSELTGQTSLWLMLNKDEVFFGKTVRQLLQTLGTEWGRNLVNENLWIEWLDDKRKKLKEELGDFAEEQDIEIIVDVRRDNEADYVRSQGGEIWSIERDDITLLSHASENGIILKKGDKVIFNKSSLEDLKQQVIRRLDE